MRTAKKRLKGAPSNKVAHKSVFSTLSIKKGGSAPPKKCARSTKTTPPSISNVVIEAARGQRNKKQLFSNFPRINPL